MAKTIELTFGGKDYTLEFTRKSVERMENSGFVVEDIERKPVSTIPLMFHGAFWAHHPFVKRDVTNEIFDSLKGKQGIISALAEMYNETLNSLVDEPDEDDEKNANWKKSW